MHFIASDGRGGYFRSHVIKVFLIKPILLRRDWFRSGSADLLMSVEQMTWIIQEFLSMKQLRFCKLEVRLSLALGEV